MKLCSSQTGYLERFSGAHGMYLPLYLRLMRGGLVDDGGLHVSRSLPQGRHAMASAWVPQLHYCNSLPY